MRIVEYKKCCKIIDEVMLFFLTRGMKDITIDYKCENHIDTLYFVVKNVTEKSYKSFKEKLTVHHEMQYEGFGWELMGDCDYDELGLVGALIDELETHIDGNDLKIKMVRRFE